MRRCGSGRSSSARTSPTGSGGVCPVPETSGTWMRSPSKSPVRSTGCGARSTRTASCSTFSYRAGGTNGPPNGIVTVALSLPQVSYPDRMSSLSYRGHRFPAAIIQHAIWLYLRFTLSYRDVEELLAERGLDLSYETVRRWVLKFGPLFARQLRQRRPRPGDR